MNVSNYFIKDDLSLCVFDWDQTMRAWYLYDLAQLVWGLTMALVKGGLLQNQIPGLDLDKYKDWLCEGYGQIDRKALHECVVLRRDFYEKFCRRA